MPQSESKVLNDWKEQSAVITFRLPGLLTKNEEGTFTVKFLNQGKTTTHKKKYGTHRNMESKTKRHKKNKKKFGTHRTMEAKTRDKKNKKMHGLDRNIKAKTIRDKKSKKTYGTNRNMEAKTMKDVKKGNNYGTRIMKLKAK